MTTSERFVLPGDLTIAPVDRFHSHARARLEASDGDVAIGRIGVRSSVKILSADAARLVEAFRAPTTIVDAVIAYARRESLDPEQTLREAYPILRGLIDARMLVSARSADAAGFEPSLAVGAYVGCFEITHCIQILEDTEVYRGRSADGDVAVKIARRGANANRRAALVREVDILRRLDGTANPRLLESGVFDGAPFLVIEWCDGGSVDALAAEYRSEAGRQDAHALFNLCCNVLAAYARLHAQGVVHGDVHPRNVVVARDGCVRVLDYDASRDRRVRGDSHDGRAGVAFFLEPEVARATLAGSPVPGPSFAGEQYALGVLLYLLVCGEHYLDLGYERERMLEQIANAPPLPFSRYGIVGWRQVERVLSVALRKSPDQRFAGVAAFAEALRTARVEVSDTCGPPAFARAARRTGAGILSGVLARAETTSFRSPTASVVAGAAGLAYALYRIAALRRDPRLLAAADVCATGIDTDRDDAYYDDEAELTPKEIGVVSPYVTATGVWVVRALIAKAMGNDAAVEEAVGAFVAAAGGPCSNRDLYLGLASTLLGNALIQDVLTDRDRLAMDALRVFADDTMRRISAGKYIRLAIQRLTSNL